MLAGRPVATAGILLALAAVFLLFFVAFKFGQFSVPFQKTPSRTNDNPAGHADDALGLRVNADLLVEDKTNPSKRWVEVLSWQPRIILFHNIISKAEADHMVTVAEPKVSRSSVVGANGQPVVNQARTSSGYFVLGPDAQDPVFKALEQRIADWTHLPVENGEAFYVLRYEVGQQYVPHTDFFDETSAAQKQHQIGAAGNRIATVITCLRSPEEGGETTFPAANINVPCVTGNAILFWDATPDSTSDPRTLHGGKPVIKGTKWAMTKWLRPRAFQ